MSLSRAAPALALLMLADAGAFAQRNLAGTPALKLALARLNVTGSVLMIGAHPDDENTALLAYFARGRKVRAAYLSLTRGEGGQNLIGPEQGDLLGVIRTQELLAARRIDGAEQFFTRAIDFGFSKTAEETLAKWGRENTLSDVVWVIRRFQPDVVILRFSGTPRDGHGHHTSSALLGREAYFAAADPARFPEQLKWVKPWQARRLLFNVFTFSRDQERSAAGLQDRLEIDLGEFDPVLGCSYGEIAGMSRSMHRSQGFGAPERRGSFKNYLTHLAGDRASADVFDGVDLTWNRVAGAAAAAPLLAEAARSFQPEHPERSVPSLLKARGIVAALQDPIARRKLKEIDETIALCAGLWLDASADRHWAVPGDTLKVQVTALNRSRLPVRLAAVELPGARLAEEVDLAYNQPSVRSVDLAIPAAQPYSQPYWLAEPHSGDSYAISRQEMIGEAEGPPAVEARFRLRVESASIDLVRPVERRWVDHVLGEQARPLAIVPPVTLRLDETAMVFVDSSPRTIGVQVSANAAGAAGTVSLEAPPGWNVSPDSQPFRLAAPGQETSLAFSLAPPSRQARGELAAVASLGGRRVALAMHTVNYPHIPPQVAFAPARARLAATSLRNLARNVGYVMGAGDEVARQLRQLGCVVTLLDEQELALGELMRFDAIVTGVRAYNTRPDLRANRQRLFDYVAQGGTLIVQYNVLEGSLLDGIGPYPLQIGRDRVSVEEAPVAFPNPRHPVLNSPNTITTADFEGWVQERGLYFATEWDQRYEPLFESHDPGEKPLLGGTLYARHGSGVFIFTAYSWFRQLPAGVPGAYRIFANFLSAGKVSK